MSVGEIAKVTGVTSSAVTQWKDGPTKSLKIAPATKLAAASGFSAMWIATGMGPEKGGSVSSPIESNVEPALELKKSRRVPITGSVRGGPDGYLVQDNGLDGWVEYWTGDPRAYALRVKGDSMHPRYRAGEYVVITPSIEAQSGRDVVVKLHDGNCLLKQLNWMREDEIQFVSINNGYEPMTIGRDEIECIERVAGSVGPDSMVF